MMKTCPHCHDSNSKNHGRFFCQSRNSWIKRRFCKSCKRTYSSRTLALDKYQKKAHLNPMIAKSLSERSSLRGLARVLGVSYMTVYRKFLWLSDLNSNPEPDTPYKTLYFDEMESSEHTKLKPLTIALAVDENCKLRGARVGTLPAKGHLARLSRQKYGFRENQSALVSEELFTCLKQKCSPKKVITDKKSSYPHLIKKYFPEAENLTFLAKRNSDLKNRYKAKSFDPLFPVNHKSGDLRDKINRFARRTWCTTKKMENLQRHLNIRIAYENKCLIC